MKKHIPMEPSLRAKQFMPFAAVSGFEMALQMAEHDKYNKEDKVTLSDDIVSEINEILSNAKKGDILEIIYYYDGEYKDIKGALVKADVCNKRIIVKDIIHPSDELYISFSDIRQITVIER